MTSVHIAGAQYESPAETLRLARQHAYDPSPEYALHNLICYFVWHNNLTPANRELVDDFADEYDLPEREPKVMEERLIQARADVARDREKQAKLEAQVIELNARRLKGEPLPRTGRDIADVIDQWREDGPVIHEPTGFAELDRLTGGGPVYGSRWYLNGQPDAGKTAFLIQVAHVFALRGVCVGLPAVDEDDADLVSRFAQRVGHSRKNCEIRDPRVLDQIEAELASLPVRFYDNTWTIEAAAADLAKFAAGRRMMLGMDSLQTVSCDAERAAQRELSEMAAVTARVQAIRKVASQYRLIAMCTSEMSRSAYRKADPSDLTSTMAASKHSGAVEYSARVLLGLRSVKDETDLIEVDIAKNKHGPSGEQVYLRVDRATQTLWEVDHEPPPKPDADERRRSKDAAAAEKVAKVIESNPKINVRDLRSKVRVAHGIGKDAVDAALVTLGPRVKYEDGPRNSKLMTLSVAERG